MLNKLNQPKGSTIGVLKDGRTIQEAFDALFLKVSPDMFKLPSESDHTEALKRALATGRPVTVDGDITCTGTINIPSDANISGAGSITQRLVTDPNFVWTADARLSPAPLLSVSAPNVRLSGIALFPVYEGISVSSGGDNFKASDMFIGGTPSKRTKASGIVAFNVSDFRVEHCTILWCGKDATWSVEQSRILSGGCRGIDFGGVTRAGLRSNVIANVGENGIFWYGASSVTCSDNLTYLCGQSGLHFAPHPNYSGVIIQGHRSILCCADGIDVRWTGAGRPRADLVMTGCVNTLCGFLYGDLTKAGIDGSGVATLAYLTHFEVTACIANNCAGTGVHLQGVSDGSLVGLDITNDNTKAAGIWYAETVSRVALLGCNIKVRGTGIGAGGNQTLTDISWANSVVVSTEGAAMSMPSNPHVRVSSSKMSLTTAKPINLRWASDGDTVAFTGTTGNAVYSNYANIAIRGLAVNGQSDGPLVQIHSSQGFSLRDSSFSNSSPSANGVALKVTGDSSYSLISKIHCWNTGGGVAFQIDDSTQQLMVEHSDIYGASGHAVLTTSGIKNLRYNNNKISGTTSYAGGETPYNLTYSR